LRERDAMLQEIHHRVKNNLQVISSLISMQMRALRDAPTRLALHECRSRVEAMAEIHTMLYRSKDYASIPFSKYARELAARVLRGSATAPGGIQLCFDLEEVFLTVDTAIPCGLILNELLTNALKHAFPNAREGTIGVELKHHAPNVIALAVTDDGVGMPAGFDPEQAQSLGLQLVVNLAGQLDGRIEIRGQPGARVCITFPTEHSPP
jgi:two-component sensor histidine kinase